MNTEQQERAAIYRLLARLFIAPVDPSLLNTLKTIDVEDQKHPGPVASAWRHLAAVSALADPDLLDDQFHRLFIGIGRGDFLPFRSYYETGFLMEKPLAQLRADLNRLGYHRQSGNNEPEDHISSICEVMALLISEKREEQRDFFQQHISSWFGRFFEDMQHTTSCSFYLAVARFAKTFLDAENAMLS